MNEQIEANQDKADGMMISTLRACGFFVRQMGLMEGDRPQVLGTIDNAMAFFKLAVAGADAALEGRRLPDGVNFVQATSSPDFMRTNLGDRRFFAVDLTPSQPVANADGEGFITGTGQPVIGATWGKDAAGGLVLIGSANRTEEGEQPFPQAWPHAQRVAAASAFLATYSDTNMEKLLGDYQVQPIIRALASMIGQWQQAAINMPTTTGSLEDAEQA